MSLLDKASLILTPNAYKESKLYSVVPNTTLGDMDVVRATTATRVNSAGLIEVVPRNLVFYSEQFDNAAWTKANSTVTSNATTAPNGTLTADRIQITSATNARVLQSGTGASLTVGQPYTFSCWIKSISGTGKVGIRSGQNGVSAIWSFTNEWVRYTFTSNAAAINEEPQLCNNTLVTGADVAPDFYAWGFQIDNGSTATEYFPTTTRLNIPRIDYTNGSCPSLLVEPQRTNTMTYSEDFTNAIWLKLNATITANTSVAPTGNTTADTLTLTSGGYLLQTLFGYNAVSGQSITISIFAKNQITNFLLFGGATTAGTDVYTIQDYGNGWYRHIRTRTFTASNPDAAIQFIIGNQIGTYIIWGAQMEVGSYATSYVPTVASSVTRNADYAVNNLQTTNANWTVFIDCYFKPYEQIFNLYIGTTTSRFISFYQSFDFFRLVGNSGSGVFAGRVMSSTEGRKKIVLQNDGTDCIVFVNGVRLGAVNPSAAAPLTGTSNIEFKLYTGGNAVGSLGKLNSLFRFDTKLTDAECIALTTL